VVLRQIWALPVFHFSQPPPTTTIVCLVLVYFLFLFGLSPSRYCVSRETTTFKRLSILSVFRDCLDAYLRSHTHARTHAHTHTHTHTHTHAHAHAHAHTHTHIHTQACQGWHPTDLHTHAYTHTHTHTHTHRHARDGTQRQWKRSDECPGYGTWC